MSDINQTLFGILGYKTPQEYLSYLERLSQASTPDLLITIQSALRYANTQNIYTLEEAEAISITLREITKILSK
jgi:hypothetical protein